MLIGEGLEELLRVSVATHEMLVRNSPLVACPARTLFLSLGLGMESCGHDAQRYISIEGGQSLLAVPRQHLIEREHQNVGVRLVKIARRSRTVSVVREARASSLDPQLVK